MFKIIYSPAKFGNNGSYMPRMWQTNLGRIGRHEEGFKKRWTSSKVERKKGIYDTL